MRDRTSSCRLFVLQRAVMAVFAPAIGLTIHATAYAAGAPVWNPAEAGIVTFTPNPANAAFSPVAVPINASATLTNVVSSTLYAGTPPGVSNYSAGLAHSESSTSAKIIIASGTGVSQSDPRHTVGASTLMTYFDAQWTIPAAGFGVPISESFSLPIGVKVGINGSASATVKVDWDYIDAGPVEHSFYEYDNTRTWLGGATGQTVLTNFTAPTVAFNPNMLNSEETLVMTATITFTADNDDSPTLIEIPTAADFSAFGVTSDQQGIVQTYTPNSLVWNNGAVGTAGVGDGTTWDTNTNPNFINNGVSGAVFTSGDSVTFNDANNMHYNVAINSVVSPGSVVVNNNNGNYVFGGTGTISGGAQLTKNGQAALTLLTSNTYVGGTTLNAGTLNIDNASALGSGTFTIVGGTIDNNSFTAITLVNNNAQNWSGNFAFGGSNSLNLGTGPVLLTTNVVVNTQGSGSSPAVLTVGGTISGLYGLTKNGAGTLLLTGNNTFTGLMIVNAGTLGFSSTSTAGIGSVGLAGGLNIGTGATVTVAAATSPSNRLLLTLGILSFAGTGGSLDLSNDDMRVQVGSLSTLISQIHQGYNGGRWNGTGGIISSSAAGNTTNLTTLGAIVNSSDGVNPLYSSTSALGPFDDTSPGATELLVKYTYYGDANLDGKVDGSDYSRIDSGFLNSGSTWFNGDFNYDGIVNGSDYTLIDNAFNTQGASLAGSIDGLNAIITSQIAVVPEPAMLGLICLGIAGLPGRRTRNNNGRIF